MDIYGFEVKAMNGTMVPLSDYKGKVMLVVNTATAPFDGVVSFKGTGRPEQWGAKSGQIVPVPWRRNAARMIFFTGFFGMNKLDVFSQA